MQLQGLTELQQSLLQTAQRTPQTMKKVLNKVGTKATQKARKKARQQVKKKTGNYHKKWKKGEVFVGRDGELVVRVINSSPHAHLIEDGHIIKNKPGGPNLGFAPGKKVLERSTREFERSGEMAKIVGDELDELLSRNRL